MRMLGVFEKNQRIRHIGHLDIQRAVQRGLRRSGLPVAYSNGFNPHIQVTFASALSTGACGKREIMDVKMAEAVEASTFLKKMNEAMPPEMQLSEARIIDDRHPALMASLKAADYQIQILTEEFAEILIHAIPQMLAQEEIVTVRKTKSGMKDTDIKPLILGLKSEGDTLYTRLVLTEKEACKPNMLISALRQAAGIQEDTEIRTLVTRNQLLGETSEGLLVPLETL